MRSFIPNALTALNIVLGVSALISTFNGAFSTAALLIVAALVADGLDGRVARYFNTSSEFGKELDSLCDVVSFGVAPAILAYVYALQEYGIVGVLAAAAFATCGALRLARFNVNTGVVKGYFMGLPIPASGCVIATYVMLGIKSPSWLLLALTVIFAYLMVSTVRYPDFKGKDGERIRIVPLVITVLVSGYILFLAHDAYLFVGFFAYALFGMLNTLFGLFES
ncbi:MAG TPA: CDP-diacylglycerol--serine O-phosphatidyltransferase [Sporomusaceae bacterium]|uniref:CDP-diacylglycerol--serine O-phosphatidyltransferase n=1 Tax=Anaerospora sp. TaxID=1960278 RepID=UPI000EC2241E|nr:CDP-diacylglycerol--serine O-phosphatidyltransferase [Anaerospora sp.]MDF2928013.1 CDP-diacylglycerol/serine O-phosphatidyltransferase [Anaerospora sp.]HAK73416.1 CDP-diacylglycerol--serine O-phosphatidyltransferase [Sporomusaceae bacterium]